MKTIMAVFITCIALLVFAAYVWPATIVEIVNNKAEAKWNKQGWHKCMCCNGVGYVKGGDGK